MTTPVQRLHYFDQQFLRAHDFVSEQDYHLAMRRRHNAAVHGWGIGEGLLVEATSATGVTVRPGYAFDWLGREIVLVADAVLDLADLPDDALAYVTIAYSERKTDPTDETGVRDDTRWTEEPVVAASASAPTEPGLTIELAQVERAGREVTGVVLTGRNSSIPNIVDGLQQAISTKVARSGDTMGDLGVSRLTVGSTNSINSLTVGGDVGIVHSLLRMGRIDWSTATGNEVLGGIGFLGSGVQHGQLSFRAGSGFEMVDCSVAEPTLNYTLGQFAYVDLRVRVLECNGDLRIGANVALRGNDSWLRLNQDKHFASGVHTPGLFAPDSLNVGGFGTWGNPGSGNAIISGSVGIGTTTMPHRLTIAAGDIQLDPGQSIRDNGRLHIAAGDRLYLLPSAGVWVTKDWNASGDLIVHGNIYANGKPENSVPDWSGGGVVCHDVFCVGLYASATKEFVIDHPVEPERMQLVHACVEGPEVAVFYRGEAQLCNGEATVELPAYFEALVRSEHRTVNVTPKLDGGGCFSPLGASDVRDGRFTVRTTDHGVADQPFYWEVKAVRADVDVLEAEVER